MSNHYYPLTICGAFFQKEYIDYLKSHIAFVKEDIEIVSFIKQFLETETDLSQYPPYMKEVIMIHKSDLLYEEKREDGYYIGIPLFDIPDHFSMKRICIDINNLMHASKILDENAPLNAITIFSKILVVSDEDLKNLGIST